MVLLVQQVLLETQELMELQVQEVNQGIREQQVQREMMVQQALKVMLGHRDQMVFRGPLVQLEWQDLRATQELQEMLVLEAHQVQLDSLVHRAPEEILAALDPLGTMGNLVPQVILDCLDFKDHEVVLARLEMQERQVILELLEHKDHQDNLVILV